mmetsp:Transcript_17042/g.55520  ORF Transcript_17042/g.55520 Transcript_17042/m.55520 type:complete len:211 (-) Transcript_17042:1350-1982(-)
MRASEPFGGVVVRIDTGGGATPPIRPPPPAHRRPVSSPPIASRPVPSRPSPPRPIRPRPDMSRPVPSRPIWPPGRLQARLGMGLGVAGVPRAPHRSRARARARMTKPAAAMRTEMAGWSGGQACVNASHVSGVPSGAHRVWEQVAGRVAPNRATVKAQAVGAGSPQPAPPSVSEGGSHEMRASPPRSKSSATAGSCPSSVRHEKVEQMMS